MAVKAFARAKINLTLHVTGQRADGYHLLDSLVCFAEVGDTVEATAAQGLSLAIDGPMAPGLPVSDDNLVLRAARAFGVDAGAALRLTKCLPVSSGIGGGSADAAAALVALARLWDRPLPGAAQVLALGADVPVCLSGRAARMRGIGEDIAPLSHPLQPGWMVLANPGVAVSTPAIFRNLTRKTNPAMPDALPQFADMADLAAFLADQRNDLAPPAEALAPEITVARLAIAAKPGCLLARMSGSGATCFGLFADQTSAESAAAAIRQDHPAWWTVAAAMAG